MHQTIQPHVEQLLGAEETHDQHSVYSPLDEAYNDRALREGVNFSTVVLVGCWYGRDA